jgi:hypothetical protein
MIDTEVVDMTGVIHNILYSRWILGAYYTLVDGLLFFQNYYN